MDSLVGNGWIVLLCLAAAGYVFGVPLLILVTFRQDAHPVLQAVDPAELSLPSEAQDYQDLVRDGLESAGFQVEGSYLMPQQMENVRAILALFVNRSTMESAMAVTIYALAGSGWKLQTQYVEFNTRYRSGREINTGNTGEISTFPTPPNTLATHISWITDPLELYRVHQAITSAGGEGSEKELRLDAKYRGDAATYLSEAIRGELEAACADGYIRLSSDGDSYKSTFVGAYLMTWTQLPPFKWFLAYSHRARVKRFLAELGVDA